MFVVRISYYITFDFKIVKYIVLFVVANLDIAVMKTQPLWLFHYYVGIEYVVTVKPLYMS